MVKVQFLKFVNLQLFLLIYSKIGGNIQDYGLDGYCKNQVAMGHISICALNYETLPLIVAIIICDQICQNPPNMHTMAKNSFHHQLIASSIN